jgi:hypothetical protein
MHITNFLHTHHHKQAHLRMLLMALYGLGARIF